MSSLPILHFSSRPPFSFERLLAMCEGVICAEDIDCVKASVGICYSAEAEPALPSAGRKWQTFETSLRNELVKTRAARKKINPEKYTRGEAYGDPYFAHIAVHAHRNPSILQAERDLDGERWRFLEKIGAGHYFDIDALIVYASKLFILERWERINNMDRGGALEDTLKQEEAV